MRGLARLIVPGAVFVLLVAASSVDGFFRDEFYYLACTRHLAWGYVDQPPSVDRAPVADSARGR